MINTATDVLQTITLGFMRSGGLDHIMLVPRISIKKRGGLKIVFSSRTGLSQNARPDWSCDTGGSYSSFD